MPRPPAGRATASVSGAWRTRAWRRSNSGVDGRSKSYGRDDRAPLHAADRLRRGLVAAHVGNPDRHADLHRRQYRRRDRFGWAPACEGAIVLDAPAASGVPARRPDATVAATDRCKRAILLFRVHRAPRRHRRCSRAFGRTGQASRSGPERWSTEPCASRATAKRPTEQCRPWCSRPSITTCSFASCRPVRRSSSASRSALAFIRICDSYNVLAEIPGTDPVARRGRARRRPPGLVAHRHRRDGQCRRRRRRDGGDAHPGRAQGPTPPDDPRGPVGRRGAGTARRARLRQPSISEDEAARARIAVYLNDDPGTGADLRLLHGGECGREGDLRCAGSSRCAISACGGT